MTAILALFFLVLGLFGMILPWTPAIRTEVVDFLLSNTATLSLFGFAFVVIGMGILVQLMHGARRHTFKSKLKAVSVEVSEKVIEEYLSVYFRDLFPYAEVPCQVLLKPKKVKVVIDLPGLPKSEQEPLVKRVEQDLASLFRDQIGYPHEILLSFSFAPL